MTLDCSISFRIAAKGHFCSLLISNINLTSLSQISSTNPSSFLSFSPPNIHSHIFSSAHLSGLTFFAFCSVAYSLLGSVRVQKPILIKFLTKSLFENSFTFTFYVNGLFSFPQSSAYPKTSVFVYLYIGLTLSTLLYQHITQHISIHFLYKLYYLFLYTQENVVEQYYIFVKIH